MSQSSKIKTLHIVRHGKALQDYLRIDDIDRPLIEKGIHNNIAVATRLVDKYAIPDIIISSPAARALHTAHIFARVMGFPPEKVTAYEKLYFKGEEALEILCEISDEIESAMIVGHNPDVTYLAGSFTRSLTDSLPTSGVATIRFETEQWCNISRSTTLNAEFIRP